MTDQSIDRCRRCGAAREEVLQLVDPLDRWAILVNHCPCGHRWTTIHTSPNNLPALKVWVSQGLAGGQIPPTTHGPGWRSFRLEGLCPPVLVGP